MRGPRTRTAADSPRSTTTSRRRGPSGDEREAQAEAERDFLVLEGTRAVGLGGRDRRAVSASERARASVTRAIRQSMARIGENHSHARGATRPRHPHRVLRLPPRSLSSTGVDALRPSRVVRFLDPTDGSSRFGARPGQCRMARSRYQMIDRSSTPASRPPPATSLLPRPHPPPVTGNHPTACRSRAGGDLAAGAAGAAAAVSGAGLYRFDCLYGPGELRHQHPGRRPVRLPPGLGGRDLEPDGHAGAIALRQAGHRHRDEPAGDDPPGVSSAR